MKIKTTLLAVISTFTTFAHSLVPSPSATINNSKNVNSAYNCKAPIDLKVVNAGKNTITISFKNFGDAKSFELRSFKAGKFKGNIDGAISYSKSEGGDNSITINGLSPKTKYDLVLRSLCKSEGVSDVTIIEGATNNITEKTVSFKKELKIAKNSIAIRQYNRAALNLSKVEPQLEIIPSSEKYLYYLIKGEIVTATNKENSLEKYKEALSLYVKAQKNQNSEEVKNEKVFVASKIEAIALEAQQAKSYDKAAEIYEYLYNNDKTDTLQLFNAAGNAVNDKNYDLALKHYNKLIELGFTGIAPVYQATHAGTGRVDIISSKEDMDELVKQKKYAHPKTTLSTSQKGGITKNIALIHYSRGNISKAEAAFAKAKADNPNDDYIKDIESQMFVDIANDYSKQGDKKKAIESYKKALALKPNSTIINQNIAAVLIGKDQGFVAKMNSLSTSKADQIIYKEYQEKRKANFTEASKYLEAYLAVKEDKNIANSLLQIYTNIKSPKADALKAKYGL